MATDPIVLWDAQGHRVVISRQEWLNKVLPANLHSAWDDPEALGMLITNSLRDGFADEVRPAADRLLTIDLDHQRAVILRSIIDLQAGRPGHAESRLRDFLKSSPQDGLALTNLAKAEAAQGRHTAAEATLLRALRADPNLDNALQWVMALHRERGGAEGERALLDEVSTFPGAWRPQLWLARSSLQHGDRQRALGLYRSILPLAGRNGEALMQITGDLGGAGMLDDAVALVLPVYKPEAHGIETGFNLLRALIGLGKAADARVLVQRLEELNVPPFIEALRQVRSEIDRLPPN